MKPLLVLIASGCLAAPLAGQTGLLVVAHGATPGWNEGVRATAAQVRWNGPVAVAFLMGEENETSGWDAGVGDLIRRGARQIVVVPLMVSSHGSHYRQVQYYAGELAALPDDLASHMHGATPGAPVPMSVTGALDEAGELGLALLEHWRALPPEDRRRPLMLMAHGPSSDAEAALWVRNLDAAIEVIRRDSGIRIGIGLLRDDAAAPVRQAAVDSARAAILALRADAADSVTVMPVLISSGRLGIVTIPSDLAGLPIRYVPAALTPSPAMARWIERVALAKVATVQ